jgi:hypothetical protein
VTVAAGIHPISELGKGRVSFSVAEQPEHEDRMGFNRFHRLAERRDRLPEQIKPVQDIQSGRGGSACMGDGADCLRPARSAGTGIPNGSTVRLHVYR